MTTPRIAPMTAPFPPEIGERLDKMMPGDVPPIALFRTFVHNMPMAESMGPWGGYELSRRLSLSMRQREIVIDRVTARCDCEYEWGVHVTFFAETVAFTDDQVRSLTNGTPDDSCWGPDEAALIRAVDELHDTSTVSDPTWAELTTFLDERQLLDLLLLAGWYHAISFAANGARVPLEDGAARFDDYR